MFIPMWLVWTAGTFAVIGVILTLLLLVKCGMEAIIGVFELIGEILT